MTAYCEINDLKTEWMNYVEILEFYFNANDVDDDIMKKAIMLSMIGIGSYRLVRNLTAPFTPADKSYQQLKILISNYLAPCRFPEGSFRHEVSETLVTEPNEGTEG